MFQNTINQQMDKAYTTQIYTKLTASDDGSKSFSDEQQSRLPPNKLNNLELF